MRRCLSPPRTTLLQPESLAAKADPFQQSEIWSIVRFGQNVLHELLLSFVPSFIHDNQVGLIDGGINPSINEGWFLRECRKEGASKLKQLLAMLRLHSDKNI